MKKKIALVLIMVIMVNMVLWADETDDSSDLWLYFGIGFLSVAVILGVIWAVSAIAEADSPDDGIRLVSANSAPDDKSTTGSVLNILQKINIGYIPQDNKTFIGLRFQY